jgi:hypothetical protein
LAPVGQRSEFDAMSITTWQFTSVPHILVGHHVQLLRYKH